MVDGRAVGAIQAGWAGRARGCRAITRGEVWLAEDHAGVHAAGNRRNELSDSAVSRISYVDIALGIHGHRCGLVHGARGCAGGGSGEAGLSQDRAGGLIEDGAERNGVYQDAIVTIIRQRRRGGGRQAVHSHVGNCSICHGAASVRDGADLSGIARLSQYRNAIGSASGKGGREAERAAGRHGEIVAAIVLQDQSRAHEARHASTDRVRLNWGAVAVTDATWSAVVCTATNDEESTD